MTIRGEEKKKQHCHRGGKGKEKTEKLDTHSLEILCKFDYRDNGVNDNNMM